jgi:hypothetical protein|tara:strand:+ start:393 stop:632 length:240 start_codon:yes stop_codon:yes gene_type:complete
MAFKLRRSRSGYRKNSPHRNDPSLIIVGNEISMCEEDGSPLEKGPIAGTGKQTGITIIMEPGKNYKFPGDYEVIEKPLN